MRIGGNRAPYLRQDRQPHYATAALDSAHTVATTSTKAPAGNVQLTRTRTRHSAQIAAAGAAMPSTRLPTCATSLSGAAYGQGGGQNMIAEPLISSVHPSPRIAALATPPPLPCAPAASETLHQAWMRLTSSSVAPTAGERRPCNGNSLMPKSKRMCSVPTAIAARPSQSHGGSRHDWPDHVRLLLSMNPSRGPRNDTGRASVATRHEGTRRGVAKRSEVHKRTSAQIGVPMVHPHSPGSFYASEFPRMVFAGNSSRCIKKYANKGYDSSAASQRPFSAAVCPLSFRDRHYRHLGLLPFVTRAEYSCKVLHKRSRAGFRELHHFGFSVIISLGWRQANEEEVWTSSTSSF